MLVIILRISKSPTIDFNKNYNYNNYIASSISSSNKNILELIT